MSSLDPGLRRALALRAIEGNLSRLRWHAAAMRFELALRRHDRALKYNADQPRIPRGNPGGGRWTFDPSGSGRSRPADRGIRIAQAGMGILLGQQIIHPSNGGGKLCVYRFDFGIVPWRMSSTNMACPPTLIPQAVTHSPIWK